jgi:hypothetical protein
MTFTSLYAIGQARVEVGRFGKDLDAAKAEFLEMCKEHALTETTISKETPSLVRFKLRPWDTRKLCDFLQRVANVLDLHGDAPDVYELVPAHATPGEYIRTGTYNG